MKKILNLTWWETQRSIRHINSRLVPIITHFQTKERHDIQVSEPAYTQNTPTSHNITST